MYISPLAIFRTELVLTVLTFLTKLVLIVLTFLTDLVLTVLVLTKCEIFPRSRRADPLARKEGYQGRKDIKEGRKEERKDIKEGRK